MNVLSRFRRGLHRVFTASWSYRRWDGAKSVFARAGETAFITRAFRRIHRWIVHSYLFRWLTAEPEPDVIVIDLRETYTVGPFIRLFDWVVGGVSRVYRGTPLPRLFGAIGRAFLAAPIRFVSAVGLLGVLVNAGVSYTMGGPTGTEWAVLLAFGMLCGVGLLIGWSWDDIRTSRFGRFLGNLFAPPELERQD